MTTFIEGTTVDTNSIQLEEIIHIEFKFYNVTFICGFTYMLTVVCENTTMLWKPPTASKQYPVRIIRFILILLKNEQQS